jgi:hypothetical protein
VSRKNKNSKTNLDKLAKVSHQTGLILMAGAIALGLLELPERPEKVVLPSRPVFELASNNSRFDPDSNPIRREREEKETGTEAAYIGYSVSQRTPARYREW